MVNSSDYINVNFKVDKNLKAQADELFKKLGINTSVALNMFLTQCVREQALPFNPNMVAPEPSKDLKETLAEVDDMINNPEKYPKFNNWDDLKDSLLSDDQL